MKLLQGLVGIVLSIAFMYGVYWLAKTVSYNIFYEDMVIRTIKETVKAGMLR